MDMPSKPERELLEWLQKKDSAVLRDRLMTAPGYDNERCRALIQNGMISAVCIDNVEVAYKISDKGRSALESAKLTLGSDRRSKVALVVSMAAAAASIAAFVRSFF